MLRVPYSSSITSSHFVFIPSFTSFLNLRHVSNESRGELLLRTSQLNWHSITKWPCYWSTASASTMFFEWKYFLRCFFLRWILDIINYEYYRFSQCKTIWDDYKKKCVGQTSIANNFHGTFPTMKSYRPHGIPKSSYRTLARDIAKSIRGIGIFDHRLSHRKSICDEYVGGAFIDNKLHTTFLAIDRMAYQNHHSRSIRFTKDRKCIAVLWIKDVWFII